MNHSHKSIDVIAQDLVNAGNALREARSDSDILVAMRQVDDLQRAFDVKAAAYRVTAPEGSHWSEKGVSLAILDADGPSMSDNGVTFEIYKGKGAKPWRWRALVGEDKIAASTDGYATYEEVGASMDAVRQSFNAPVRIPGKE